MEELRTTTTSSRRPRHLERHLAWSHGKHNGPSATARGRDEARDGGWPVEATDASAPSEEELAARSRTGDGEAFEVLYLRHRDAAHRLALMWTASPVDAEDAVAEGVARLFAALPRSADGPLSFGPYLMTCVRNAAFDRLRRQRRVDLCDTPPDCRGGREPEEITLAGYECALVAEALQTLPARWRQVLWLTEVEGMGLIEVSKRIGMNRNAVAALAYRARKGLREAYLRADLYSRGHRVVPEREGPSVPPAEPAPGTSGGKRRIRLLGTGDGASAGLSTSASAARSAKMSPRRAGT